MSLPWPCPTLELSPRSLQQIVAKLGIAYDALERERWNRESAHICCRGYPSAPTSWEAAWTRMLAALERLELQPGEREAVKRYTGFWLQTRRYQDREADLLRQNLPALRRSARTFMDIYTNSLSAEEALRRDLESGEVYREVGRVQASQAEEGGWRVKLLPDTLPALLLPARIAPRSFLCVEYALYTRIAFAARDVFNPSLGWPELENQVG